MKFGEFALEECEGAVLAHGVRTDDRFFKKGLKLTRSDIAALHTAGKEKLLVAILDSGDVGEDEAAMAIANLLRIEGVSISGAGTGRVNFHAQANGLFQVNKSLVDAVNAIDPGITFATLNNLVPVLEGRMVATVKIIPYGISAKSIEALKPALTGATSMFVSTYRSCSIGVISTLLPSLKEKTIAKTIRILEDRFRPSGSKIIAHTMVAHKQEAVREAIASLAPKCDLLIVFGASAISDEADIIPAALIAANGQIERLGMPVDPGNLLMLGDVDGTPVIGAPGCARSPADNGFDFVLNRLLAGVEVISNDIAGMGVGGLLMEIGSRPQPRIPSGKSEQKIATLVLAGGQSRRMGATNKLTTQINGAAMVRKPVEASIQAGIADVTVVTGHDRDTIQNVLKDLVDRFEHNPDFADGLSTSLKKGIGSLDSDFSHALILLGDMPEITSEMIKVLVSTVNDSPENSIIVATNHGKRGNPVIWPRAYFEELCSISGDTGARHLIGQYGEQVVEVEIGEAASLDIDTPQALADYKKKT